jgi:hypothetical protein
VVDTRQLLAAHLRHIPIPPSLLFFYHTATFSRVVVADRHLGIHDVFVNFGVKPDEIAAAAQSSSFGIRLDGPT